MNPQFKETILRATKAQDIKRLEVIQKLWSGYGEIVRYKVLDSAIENLHRIIVKHVRLPQQKHHPRGWNTNLSHNRKVHSYEVETAWYSTYNRYCDDTCRTPHCLAMDKAGEEVLIVLEDLDDSGYPERRNSVSMDDIELCLCSLAHFHATFVGVEPKQLWESGTYWHLQTRPDELEVLEDKPLKEAAAAIDDKLRQAKYQSFVHGDAKLANFCFGKDKQGHTQVALLDFQYVGGGCGMKDVAYFIGSCLYEEDCERYETPLLDVYFEELKIALQAKQPNIDAGEMEQEWRSLYHYAWADFHRFLKGWSPGHWKINGYSERICQEIISVYNLKLDH